MSIFWSASTFCTKMIFVKPVLIWNWEHKLESLKSCQFWRTLVQVRFGFRKQTQSSWTPTYQVGKANKIKVTGNTHYENRILKKKKRSSCNQEVNYGTPTTKFSWRTTCRENRPVASFGKAVTILSEIFDR